MLLQVANLLTPAQVTEFRQQLDRADWVDGRITAGYQAAQVKDNRQVPEEHPVARQLGGVILAALERNGLFISAALPRKVYPPVFNCYGVGQTFGLHVDSAIRQVPGSAHRVRTDLSATLFLSAPEAYDGGELVIESSLGSHTVKLPAGHMILYPGTSLHHVTPVTRGARYAAFFWIESMIRIDADRAILFDLDTAIQQLARTAEQDPLLRLTNVYQNLLRRWADT